MKKILKIIILITIIMFLLNSYCFAQETAQKESEQISQQEVLESQQDSLNISGFIKEAQKYTENTFEDINLNELFTSAITNS